VTVRCSIDVAEVGRLVPAPFVSGDGRPVAWLEVDGAGARLALYGSPPELRALAAAALTAAEQAQEFASVAERLRIVAGASGTG
jgi:hypothetical protein